MEKSKYCYVDALFQRKRKKEGKEEENICRGRISFFLEEMKNRERKGGNIWRRFLQKLSRILKSLSFSLGLETIANFGRASISVSENLVSEKSIGSGNARIDPCHRVTLIVPSCHPGWEDMENLRGNLR